MLLASIPWLPVLVGYCDSKSPYSLPNVFYVCYLPFSVPQIVNCCGLQKLRVWAGF